MALLAASMPAVRMTTEAEGCLLVAAEVGALGHDDVDAGRA